MADQPTDRGAAGVAARPQDEIAQRLQRLATSITRKNSSDLNQAVPPVEYNTVPAQGGGTRKIRFFDTAPTPLKRLLGSPLVQKGPFAKGPSNERLIASGWGDARPSSYEPGSPHTIHYGLDFPGPIGEPVYASADGIVTFSGWQTRGGRVDVDLVHADYNAKTYVDARGVVVWSTAMDAAAVDKDKIGFGGICAHVTHNGDFQGYRTEYYHLTSVTVSHGQHVLEGQQIGTLGATGFAGLFFSSLKSAHLHYQVAFVDGSASALIRPTAIVPNYWPGHADSTVLTTLSTKVGPALLSLGLAPAGTQVISNMALTHAQGADRATIMENQGVEEVKQRQADHNDLVAGRLGANQSALYTAVASFQQRGVVVAAPMTFDFTTGTWSDGRPI